MSARKNPPRLMLGPLTGRIYIATRYKIIDAEKGTFEAQEKYDVTNQFMDLKAQAEELFTYTPVAASLDSQENE
jgi:hypothetical protein